MPTYGDGEYGDGEYGTAVWQDFPDTGGIPCVDNLPPGALVYKRGQVQYGGTLLGADTRAGLRQLVGWRDLADTETTDSIRPQAHGGYPGAVYAGPLVVTGVFLVRGTPEAKALALEAIERATQPSEVEQPLVVHDGGTPTMRMARVIGRSIPQERHFNHAPVEVSVQWLCADPHRYDLATLRLNLTPLVSVGGIVYPLVYPLHYGDRVGNNAGTLTNTGTAHAPLVASFVGPMVNPAVTTNLWTLRFLITLADGETLTVNTADGSVRLNGDADRLYTIDPASDPVDGCSIPPGDTPVRLSAESETGSLLVTLQPAYL